MRRTAVNQNNEQFVYECMKFAIVRNSHYATLQMNGKCKRTVLYWLPKDVTVDQARFALMGYLEGRKDAQKEMRSALDTVKARDIQHDYWSAE